MFTMLTPYLTPYTTKPKKSAWLPGLYQHSDRHSRWETMRIEKNIGSESSLGKRHVFTRPENAHHTSQTLAMKLEKTQQMARKARQVRAAELELEQKARRSQWSSLLDTNLCQCVRCPIDAFLPMARGKLVANDGISCVAKLPCSDM